MARKRRVTGAQEMEDVEHFEEFIAEEPTEEPHGEFNEDPIAEEPAEEPHGEFNEVSTEEPIEEPIDEFNGVPTEEQLEKAVINDGNSVVTRVNKPRKVVKKRQRNVLKFVR